MGTSGHELTGVTIACIGLATHEGSGPDTGPGT